MSSAFKLLCCIISLWLLSSPLLIHQAVGSQSLLNHSGYQQPELVVQLDAANFNSVLKDTTANHTIVEFYAHWCPACRNYKPQFEKVARLFNGAAATYPDTVLVTRLDCAIKANTDICDKFSVTHYPMLFWGTPSGFAAGSINANTGKSEIRTINDGRTADRLLKWINTQLGSSFIFKDDILYHGKDELLQSNVADPAQVVGSRSLLNHNFDSVLKDTTANHSIIEFWAHWSPACRNFQPHFEKVARLFNGAAATYPDTVLVARVDCAIRANTKLCDKFSVTHYPTLFWGTPSGFAAGSIDANTVKSEIRTINDGRTADRLLTWINTQLGSSYIFKDDILHHGKDELLQSNVAESAQFEI